MHVAMECVAAAGIRQSAQLFTGAFLWFTCIYPSLLFTHISCCYCCPCCVALTNASTIAFFGSAESSSRFTMLRSPFCCSCRSFTSSESLSAASSARRAVRDKSDLCQFYLFAVVKTNGSSTSTKGHVVAE